MFMCLVIVGESTNSGGGPNTKMPPEMPGRPGEKFDSINNGNGGHFIVYDNNKSYPGYVITYS